MSIEAVAVKCAALELKKSSAEIRRAVKRFEQTDYGGREEVVHHEHERADHALLEGDVVVLVQHAAR